MTCWCTVGQPNFFLENWDKLHARRLAKSWQDTNFQPARTSFDHASEAPKVLKAVRISPTWGPLELRRHGQTMSKEAENWCPATIWPNVGRGVCPSFPKKKFGLAQCPIGNQFRIVNGFVCEVTWNPDLCHPASPRGRLHFPLR